MYDPGIYAPYEHEINSVMFWFTGFQTDEAACSACESF